MGTWKPIPREACIISKEHLPGCGFMKTERFKINPETYIPDKTIVGTVNRIPAIIGFKEWVSGPGDIYKQYEPVMYMEMEELAPEKVVAHCPAPEQKQMDMWEWMELNNGK